MKTNRFFWKNFKNTVLRTQIEAGRKGSLGDFLPKTIQYSLEENEPRITISHANTLVTLHFVPDPKGRPVYQLSVLHGNECIVLMDYILQPKLSAEVKHDLGEVTNFLSQFLKSNREQQVKKRYKKLTHS